MPAHCSLPSQTITFPAGLVTCTLRGPPCLNDHMAWAPRQQAAAYFEATADLANCHGRDFEEHMLDGGATYLRWQLARRSVGATVAWVNYTLMRGCSAAVSRDGGAAPECYVWEKLQPQSSAVGGRVELAPGVTEDSADFLRRGRGPRRDSCHASWNAYQSGLAAELQMGERSAMGCKYEFTRLEIALYL